MKLLTPEFGTTIQDNARHLMSNNDRELPQVCMYYIYIIDMYCHPPVGIMPGSQFGLYNMEKVVIFHI